MSEAGFSVPVKREITQSQQAFDLVALIKSTMIVKWMREKRCRNLYFSERGVGLHYGVFSSFHEARQWLPASREFDHDEFVQEYIDVRSKHISSFDYPMILWLKDIFSNGGEFVYDIGGSVGNHYYAYKRYLQYPDRLHWRVHELPASVKLGRKLAENEGTTQLSFTEDLDVISARADVWVAAGAIEFIEAHQLDVLLGQTAHLPSHILLNKLPLFDGADYVSTQNIGKMSFVPHYVYNYQNYVERIQKFGYDLVDCWDVPDRNFSFPGAPERCFGPYRGLYFRHQSPSR